MGGELNCSPIGVDRLLIAINQLQSLGQQMKQDGQVGLKRDRQQQILDSSARLSLSQATASGDGISAKVVRFQFNHPIGKRKRCVQITLRLGKRSQSDDRFSTAWIHRQNGLIKPLCGCRLTLLVGRLCGCEKVGDFYRNVDSCLVGNVK